MDRSSQRAKLLTNRWSPTVPRLLVLAAYALIFATTTVPVGAHTSDDVEHAKSDRNAAGQNVARNQDELESALTEYDRVHAEREDVEENVDLTQRRLESYRAESDNLDATVREAIVAAHVSTGLSDVLVAPGAETFQDVVMARYLEHQMRGRQRANVNRLLMSLTVETTHRSTL